MTSQSVSFVPLIDEGVVDDMAGFQIAVSRGSRVIVLDLLNHPCAGHILDDVARAGASGSIAELVAAIPGAELVAGVTGDGSTQSWGVVESAHLKVLEPTSISVAPQAEVLTRRERAVLELVTQGYANREIAGRLGLGMSSIKTYIRHAYRKIDVSTRAEAVQWGAHHGAGC